MQVVLLAAGMGIRLGHLTRVAPKALVPVKERLLIDYTLTALIKNPKVEEILVVGGFEHKLLQAHLAQHYFPVTNKITLLENTDYTSGNYYSLAVALPYLERDFVVTNVDHVFSEKTWDFLLQRYQGVSVFADFEREFLDDEMKVYLNAQQNLEKISKTLKTFQAAYVGVTSVSRSSLSRYKEAAKEVAKEYGEKAVVENILAKLAEKSEEIQVIPFDANTWYEVDTPQDLLNAEKGLKENKSFNLPAFAQAHYHKG